MWLKLNMITSYSWIIQRLKEKTEGYGIEVIEVGEHKTSSICPFCGIREVRKHRGLFYCPECRGTINTDAVGVLNIAKRHGAIIPSLSWDRDNGLVAQPLLLRWDGCRWEGKSPMNTQRNEHLRSKNLPT